MQKKTGVHFYINIANFDDVAEKEEAATQEVKHSIHELDTFFSSVDEQQELVTDFDKGKGRRPIEWVAVFDGRLNFEFKCDLDYSGVAEPPVPLSGASVLATGATR